MPYKLYLDKSENFECEVSVKNASLKNSIARLVVECGDISFVFNGKIDGNKSTIPIKRLKGLIEENVKGKICLEVVVEDTYFKPWESDFVVEEHKSIKVNIKEQTESSKPSVEIKTGPLTKYIDKPGKTIPAAKKRGINIYTPIKELSIICERFGINKQNVKKNKKSLVKIIKEYFNSCPEYKKHKSTILRDLPNILK